MSLTESFDVADISNPQPGQVYVERMAETVGPLPAGRLVALRVMASTDPVTVGGIYILDGGPSVAIVRMLGISADEWHVEQFGADMPTRIHSLPRREWPARASITVT